MSRILIAWELGGGYGHLTTLAPLTRRLIEAGHTVHLALRDLLHAESVLGDLGCPLLQAPVQSQVKLGLRSAETFAQLLSMVGYADEWGLTGLVRAWRGLFELVQPDLLIAEHAPTALLAARSGALPRVALGNGFTCPPPTRPLPVLSSTGRAADAAQIALEAQVLATANGALARVGAPALEALGDIYAADDCLLCTFEELDAFAAHRPGARYDGPWGQNPNGVAPQWPAQGTRRLFGYLKADIPGFEALIQYLSICPEGVLVHVPGMPDKFVKRFASPTLRLSREPVDIAQVAGDCDGAICLAGIGTTCQFLLAGCPLLLIPSQREQQLLAERVAATGAGLMALGTAASPPPWPALIRQLLGDARLRTGARRFAQRHKDFNASDAVESAVGRIEALL